MICAIVNNGVVEQVREVTQEEFDQGIANKHQAVLSLVDMLPQPQVGWVFNGSTLSPPAVSMKISKLALRQRFTTSELVAVKVASATNPVIAVILDNLQVSTYIDLGRSEVAQALGYLVTQGLLTSERMTTILTTPPTYQEIYKGIK